MEYRQALVTGGAGMIGLAVVNRLHASGMQVRILDLDGQQRRVKSFIPAGVAFYAGTIMDESVLTSAIAGCDLVIHLAAILGVRRTEQQPLACLDVNITGTRKVLQASADQGVKKFVFASSSEVYGEPIENPLTETSLTQGRTIYAVSKLAGEELCKAFYRDCGLKYCLLRYFNCYGPCQVAQFVVPRFVRSVLEDRPPIVYGDGRQMRSYTYVSDAAAATVSAAISKEADNEVFNISNGSELVNLVDLADLVIRIGGRDSVLNPIIHNHFDDADRKPEREIYERYSDSLKLRHVLGWSPQVSLECGIHEVFQRGTLFDDWVW